MNNDGKIKFKKNLGQNFIFDKNLLAAIVNDAAVLPFDTVLEIGAGAGTLTAELAKKAHRITAIEIDRELEPILNANLEQFNNVRLVFADVLKLSHNKIEEFTQGDEFKIVANLPYYITTPLLFYFLESSLKLLSMTIMVQKEVAERIAAKPGSKTFGALSLSVQARADVFIKRIVKRSAFTPSPDVDSAVVRLEIKRPFDSFLSRVIRGLFSMRRKTVLNNICAAFDIGRESALDVLAAAGVLPESRAEQLGLEHVRAIADALSQKR